MSGIFTTRPSASIVSEILQYIRDTGEPHTWRGHTHDKPARTSTDIIYLGEYDLPRSHHIRSRWAPCPICSPDAPKYFRKGMIVWFRQEGVIRNIGGDCFVSLVGEEAHSSALRQFRKEQQQERDAAFVDYQLPLIEQAIPAIRENLELCQAIDTFQARLLPRLGERIVVPLWNHIRASGDLRVVERVMATQLRGGELVERLVDQERRYATVEGFQILEPPARSRLAGDFEPKLIELTSAIESLRSEVDAASRERLIRRVTSRLQDIRDISRRAHELKAFARLVNIRTLKTWAARPDAPIRFFIDIQGTRMRVGKDEASSVEFAVPEAVLRDVSEVPNLLRGL